MLPFKLPIAEWIEALVDFLLSHFQPVFRAGSNLIFSIVDALTSLLLAVPAWAMVLAWTLIAWKLAGKGVATFTFAGLLLIDSLGLWQATFETFTLIVSAEVIVVALGLPLGIWAARSDPVDRILRPFLDLMQTMPAFVYLIPAVMFFGLGLVPGVMATVVFALPPLVRLTNLGIRQVPTDLIEAGESFGSTSLQLLVKIQLPVALPTIMAGINQSIMLALSMVVIAAMIGAGGIGAEVLRGIQRLEIGRGFVAGLAVVILAIILDRVTQRLGQQTQTIKEG